MMSEKRFTLSNFASPSQLSDVCDDGGKMLNSEVVELLNEQQAIIEYLTIEKHQADKRFQTIIAELKKENEQLRKQLDFYLLDEFEWKEKYGDVLDE